MEEILQLETSQNTIRTGAGVVVMFTPGEKSFLVYNSSSQATFKKDTEHQIVNIECSDRYIFVFHDHYYQEYDIKTCEHANTVEKPGITLKFMLGRSKSMLIRGNDEILVVRDSNIAPIVHRVNGAGLIRGKYLFCISKDKVLDIYEQKNKVYSAPISGALPSCIDIKDSKVYCLQGDKIVGHDLNIYLDDVRAITPTRFTNLENEIILYDAVKKMLCVYQKNLLVLLFSCSADDYSYDESELQLFVVHGGALRIYKRVNEYQRDFQFITKSVDYVEQEDEFDESDSSYTDLGVDLPTIPTQF